MTATIQDRGHCGHDTHSVDASVLVSREGAMNATTPDDSTPPPQEVSPGEWLILRKWAETFDDAQKYRIATGNRLGYNASGGRTKNAPKIEATLFSPYYQSVLHNEADAKRALVVAYRDIVPAPIRDFQKSTPGLGEHTMALLLGRIGNPRTAVPHFWFTKKQLAESGLDHDCDERCKPASNRHLLAGESYDRSVSQLLQYCGHGAPKAYVKGDQNAQLANGSPMSKKIVFTIVDCAIKEGGRSVTALLEGEQSPEDAVRPYRRLYEEIRLDQVGQVHSTECKRCGPSGSPAQPGDPWSLAHAHAAAMRKVGKQFLKDLWEVSQRS